MHSTPALDIRRPIGGLFVVLGLLLAAYGMADAGHASSLAPDRATIDLWWGVVMLVVGALFLWAAQRADRTSVASR